MIELPEDMVRSLLEIEPSYQALVRMALARTHQQP